MAIAFVAIAFGTSGRSDDLRSNLVAVVVFLVALATWSRWRGPGRRVARPRRRVAVLATVGVLLLGVAVARTLRWEFLVVWMLAVYALASVVGGRALLIAGVLSPPVVTFAEGVSDYVDGEVVFRTIGRPRGVALDPLTRAPVRTRGCFVFGGEWLVDSGYNLGVATMTRAFGLADGVYDGPLVTRDEADEALLRGGRALDEATLASDSIQAPHGRFELVPGTGRFLRALVGDAPRDRGPLEARTAAIGDRILVVEVVSRAPLDRRARIALDRVSGLVVMSEVSPLLGIGIPAFERYRVVSFEADERGVVGTIVGIPTCHARGVDSHAALAELDSRGAGCDRLRDDQLVPMPRSDAETR